MKTWDHLSPLDSLDALLRTPFRYLMTRTLDQNRSPLRENVRLIASARIILWIVAQLFLLFDYLFLNLAFNLILTEAILSLFALSALISFSHLRSGRLLTTRYVSAQLISDVLIMSLLFHVTGGSANPFVSLLLFPLTISAATLSVRFTWYMAVLTLSCYGSLYLFDLSTLVNLIPGMEMPVPMEDPHAHHMHHPTEEQSAFSLHLIGMWFNFALSAALISFFILKMREELRLQQNKINEQREQLLRDEHLLGIATQAASAAHHISTPLSTMAVLVSDLQDDYKEDLTLSEDLALLSSQIGNCKQVLDDLRHQAHSGRQEKSASVLVATLVDEFRLLRPGVELEQRSNLKENMGQHISADPSLRMAILNILSNAADASPHKVRFEATLDKQDLMLVITDFGNNDENNVSKILNAAEQPVESEKDNGMGIGLFLSHATINRHRGKISVEAPNEGGTRVRISLPLTENLTSNTEDKA